MKKSTKIILPALALLVLGTTAAATGTVAWFASNGLVSATGMEVQCSTSKNLLISNKAPSESGWGQNNYGTTVKSLHAAVKELSPSSTTSTLVKSGSPTYYTVDSKVDAVTGGVVKDSVVSEINESVGYVKHSFWLAAQSLTDLSLKIKTFEVKVMDDPTTADVNESTQSINNYISQSLRFAYYYVDGTDQTANKTHSEICYVGSGSGSYLGLKGAGTVTSVADTEIKAKEGNNAEATISESVTPKVSTSIEGTDLGKILSTKEAKPNAAGYTWSQIDFYFWYEGQDARCTAQDALSVQRLSFEIELQADTTATQTPSQGQGEAA